MEAIEIVLVHIVIEVGVGVVQSLNGDVRIIE